MKNSLRLKDVCFYKNGTNVPSTPKDRPICRIVIVVEDVEPEYFEMVSSINITINPKKQKII